MWWAERRTVEEREGDERRGESSECCGGDGERGGAVCEGNGGDETALGAGIAGYDSGVGTCFLTNDNADTFEFSGDFSG